jgi:hypothetical protein
VLGQLAGPHLGRKIELKVADEEEKSLSDHLSDRSYDLLFFLFSHRFSQPL